MPIDNDFAILRAALTMDPGTIAERRHTTGHAALDRIEEQFTIAREALEQITRDYSPARRAGAEAALALTRLDLISNPPEKPKLALRCPNCLADLRGYPGPLCRYCDPNAYSE